MPLTPAEIASMVADIDELEADTPLTILSHVRALAAELRNEQERVRVQTSALRYQIENWTKVRDKNFALESENEALRKERDRYKAALERIASVTAAAHAMYGDLPRSLGSESEIAACDAYEVAREALKGSLSK